MPGVLEGPSNQCRTQHLWAGAGMGDHKVLAAGLPHQPWIGPITTDVGSDALPQVLEGLGRSGEMDAGESWVAQRNIRNLKPVTGQHVDHARRQASLFQEPDREMRGKLLSRARLPDHHVPQQAAEVGRLPAIAVKLNGVIA